MTGDSQTIRAQNDSDDVRKKVQPVSNTLAYVSFACGVISLPTCLFVIGLVFGIVGLVFGVTQLATSRAGRGWAWAGLGLSGLGVVASLGVMVIYGVFLRQAMTDINLRESYESWVGAAAPDFMAEDETGKYLELSEFRGKRVILDFQRTHCAPCQREVPLLTELRSRVPLAKLAIIGVTSEPPKVVRAFIAENHINYPIIARKDLPAPYRNVTATPAAIIIDGKGVIQRILLGYSTLDELTAYASGRGSDAPKSGSPAGK